MSPKFSIDSNDLKKIGKGLLIAVAGALAVALQSLAGVQIHLVLGSVDFSAVATLLEAALVSTLVNLLRKFVADNSGDQSVPIA